MKSFEEEEIIRIDKTINDLEEEKKLLYSIILFNKIKDYLSIVGLDKMLIFVENTNDKDIYITKEVTSAENAKILHSEFSYHKIKMPVGWYTIKDEILKSYTVISKESDIQKFLKDMFPPEYNSIYIRRKLEVSLVEKSPQKKMKI